MENLMLILFFLVIILMIVWGVRGPSCTSAQCGGFSSLANKHILLVNACHPPSLAIAKLALVQGAFVSLLSPDAPSLSAARSSLLLDSPEPSSSDRIFSQIADIFDPSQAASSIHQAFKWRPVDILVFHCGACDLGMFDQLEMEEIGKVTPANFMGAVYVAHAAIPLMKQRGPEKRSALVFVSSSAGLSITKGVRVDAITQYALKGLAELLRFELLQHNVGVHLVLPGSAASAVVGGQAQKAGTHASQTAQKLAHATLEAVKNGRFLVTTGLDGFLVGVLARGTVPADSWGRAVIEFVLLFPLKLVSIIMSNAIFRQEGKAL